MSAPDSGGEGVEPQVDSTVAPRAPAVAATRCPPTSQPLPDAPALGDLLRLLAHDLRNPLAALESNLSFLDGEADLAASTARECLEDVKLCSDGLLRVIDGLEMLGRFLQGGVTEEPGPAPLGRLIAQAVASARAAARSHGVELCAGTTEKSELQVRVGREMFVRALRALLHNAIQHAPQGSRVVLSVSVEGSHVVVKLEDAGFPLEAGLLQEAFTAAGQLRAKSSRGGRYSGGLGLFSARVCAEAAGADVRAASPPSGNAFELVAQRA